MPYSRAKEKRLAKLVKWPDIRYNPATGEPKLFYEAKEVPFGWLTKKPHLVTPKMGEVLDRPALEAQLRERSIEINPIWATAHLKRVLDDCSPTR